MLSNKVIAIKHTYHVQYTFDIVLRPLMSFILCSHIFNKISIRNLFQNLLYRVNINPC